MLQLQTYFLPLCYKQQHQMLCTCCSNIRPHPWYTLFFYHNWMIKPMFIHFKGEMDTCLRYLNWMQFIKLTSYSGMSRAHFKVSVEKSFNTEFRCHISICYLNFKAIYVQTDILIFFLFIQVCDIYILNRMLIDKMFNVSL